MRDGACFIAFSTTGIESGHNGVDEAPIIIKHFTPSKVQSLGRRRDAFLIVWFFFAHFGMHWKRSIVACACIEGKWAWEERGISFFNITIWCFLCSDTLLLIGFFILASQCRLYSALGFSFLCNKEGGGKSL